MKTLQDQAQQFLKKRKIVTGESKDLEIGFSNGSTEILSELLASFAKQEVHRALVDAAQLQDELRDKHYDDYNEDDIVYQGILSLKEKY